MRHPDLRYPLTIAILMSVALLFIVSGGILAQGLPPPPAVIGPLPGSPLTSEERALVAREAAAARLEEVEKEVETNPGLLNDPQYLAAHPRLRQFLSDYPRAVGLMQQNPQEFFDLLKQHETAAAP
jgi:hypothetical protein